MATAAAKPWPEVLRKLGLNRPVDLVLHFPLRFEDESTVQPLASLGFVTWPSADDKQGSSVQCQVEVIDSQVKQRCE